MSGLFVLALEVLVLRLLALVAPSSFQTTGALLANVILFLAIGSLVVAGLNRLGVSHEVQLIGGFTIAAVACIVCPVILYENTRQLVSIRYLVAAEGDVMQSVSQYWGILCIAIAMSAGAALLASGLVFPAVMSIHSRNDPQGHSIGLLLAINGLGGLAGSELANDWLVANFGIYGGFAVLGIALAIFTAVVSLLHRYWLWTMVMVVAAMALSVPLLGAYKDLQYVSPNSKNKYAVESTTFGREGVLLVIRDKNDSRSILMNNQYILGSSGVATVERRQLLLPWLLHPDAESVCSLGLATGISAGGLETLENPPTVVAVELSRMVADAARKHFRKENRAFFERAGNQIVEDDARSFIAAANEEFDIVVADLFRPHGAGEGRLFSIEHFENVKRALKPEGMFCQWLPAHQLNQKQFHCIAATFQQVFPESLVVLGSSSSSTPSIGLCAWKSGRKWTTEELTAKIGSARTEKNLKDTLLLNSQLIIVGTLPEDAWPDSPINTLDNAKLELDAGRFWILKDLRPKRPQDTLKNGFLSGKNWKDFVEKLNAETTPVLDPVHRQQYNQILK